MKHGLNTNCQSRTNLTFSGSRLHAAVNRIYYSAFYMLSALALKHGFFTSKHRQIIGWFNKEFVKENKVSGQAGKFVHNAYDKRSLGDYDDFIRFSPEDVSSMLEKAKAFIDEIDALIQMWWYWSNEKIICSPRLQRSFFLAKT